MSKEDDERIVTKSLSSLIKRFSSVNVVENIEKEYSNSFHSAIAISQIDDPSFIRNVKINQEDLNREIERIGDEVLSPMVVVKTEDRYEIVYPRIIYYAAKEKGIEGLNCFVIDVSEEEKLFLMATHMKNDKESSVVELSYVLNRLYRRYHISQEEIAEAMSWSRSQVTNVLRIRKLPQSVINHLIDRDISLGHVRALMTLKDEQIIEYTNYIIDHNLSVRDTEKMIYSLKHSFNYDASEDAIRQIYNCNVQINSNKITLSFKNDKDFKKGLRKLSRRRRSKDLISDENDI
ncbi:MAG: ParB/RepB/Spo0J family partition protein [Coprobacillus sp.]|nr:ParB/RepB/Spo0J family partition protein [Coprobacillus sp.]